jgi:hypothetical protein
LDLWRRARHCPVCPLGICDDRHQTKQGETKPPNDDEEEEELERMEQQGGMAGSKVKTNEFQKKELDYFVRRYNHHMRDLDQKAFERMQYGWVPHEEPEVLAEVEIVSVNQFPILMLLNYVTHCSIFQCAQKYENELKPFLDAYVGDSDLDDDLPPPLQPRKKKSSATADGSSNKQKKTPTTSSRRRLPSPAPPAADEDKTAKKQKKKKKNKSRPRTPSPIAVSSSSSSSSSEEDQTPQQPVREF